MEDSGSEEVDYDFFDSPKDKHKSNIHNSVKVKLLPATGHGQSIEIPVEPDSDGDENENRRKIVKMIRMPVVVADKHSDSESDNPGDDDRKNRSFKKYKEAKARSRSSSRDNSTKASSKQAWGEEQRSRSRSPARSRTSVGARSVEIPRESNNTQVPKPNQHIDQTVSKNNDNDEEKHKTHKTSNKHKKQKHKKHRSDSSNSSGSRSSSRDSIGVPEPRRINTVGSPVQEKSKHKKKKHRKRSISSSSSSSRSSSRSRDSYGITKPRCFDAADGSIIEQKHKNTSKEKRRRSDSSSYGDSDSKKSSRSSSSSTSSSSGSSGSSGSESDITDVSPMASPNVSPQVSRKHREADRRSPRHKDCVQYTDTNTNHQEALLKSNSDSMDLALLMKAVLDMEKREPKNGTGRRVIILPPPTNKNRKNFSFQNDKVREIDRENQRLLNNIVQKHSPKKKMPKKQQPLGFEALRRITPSAVNRQKEQRRIEMENLEMLKRLQTVRSTKGMSKNEQVSDYRRQVLLGVPTFTPPRHKTPSSPYGSTASLAGHSQNGKVRPASAKDNKQEPVSDTRGQKVRPSSAKQRPGSGKVRPGGGATRAWAWEPGW